MLAPNSRPTAGCGHIAVPTRIWQRGRSGVDRARWAAWRQVGEQNRRRRPGPAARSASGAAHCAQDVDSDTPGSLFVTPIHVTIL